MKKLISFLLTALLTASIAALPCSAKEPAQTQEPKHDDLDDMVMTEPGNGGPLVEYDLNLYHIKDDGTIEYLKDAYLETANYPDGYICSITFKTSEFSTFFTAKKDLDISSFLDEGSAQALRQHRTKTA